MKNHIILFFFVLCLSFIFVRNGFVVYAADTPPADAPPSAAPSTYTVPVTELPTQVPIATDTPTPTPVPVFEPELSPWLFIVPGIVLFAVIIF
jgi:hypothetical protein